MKTPVTIIKYAIRRDGDQLPVTYGVTENENAYACCSVSHRLDHKNCEVSGAPVWYADTYEAANFVMHNPAEYYNAEYATPQHDLELGLYEVVKVTMLIEKA